MADPSDLSVAQAAWEQDRLVLLAVRARNDELVDALAAEQVRNDALETALAACIDAAKPPAASWGHPVYTDAQVAAWSTKSPEYSRLASSWAGNVNRTLFDYGTSVTTTERDAGLKDMGVWAKTQAVLYRAELNDGSTAQRTVAVTRQSKVYQQLNQMRDIGLGFTPPEACFALDGASDNKQHRLVLGWCLTNYCQAASLIGYRDDRFDAFLRRMEPLLFWTGSNNWQASFDDSALAVAVYLRDQALYDEAKARFEHHLTSQVYHPTYDGPKVAPIHKEDGQNPPLHTGPGTPNWAWTVKEWGYIAADGTAKHQDQPLRAGSHTEDDRDLGHVQMAHGAHVHSCRTIIARGEQLSPVVLARVREALDNNATRVLYNLKNPGKFLAPVPTGGQGGGSRLQSWWGARVLLGPATPPSVAEMLTRQEVTAYPPAGANHMVAEPFADSI